MHRTRIGRLARPGLWILTLGLLYWVLRSSQASAREVVARRPDGAFLLLSFALCIGGLLTTFVRWYLLVHALKLPLRLRDAIRLGFMGNAVDLVIPGQVGGDVLKATFLCRIEACKTQAIASIILDRVLGVSGLFLLAGVAGLLSWRSSPVPVRALIALIWIGITLSVVLLFFATSPKLLRPLGRLAVEKGRIGTVVFSLYSAALAYRDQFPTVLVGLALAVAGHGLYALAFYAESRALLPLAPPLSQYLIVVPLTLLTTAIPLPMGALGLSEGVGAQLFRLLDHADGAISMLGFRLVSLAVGCISVLVLLANLREVNAVRSPEASR